jgi:hypothetical protein
MKLPSFLAQEQFAVDPAPAVPYELLGPLDIAFLWHAQSERTVPFDGQSQPLTTGTHAYLQRQPVQDDGLLGEETIAGMR